MLAGTSRVDYRLRQSRSELLCRAESDLSIKLTSPHAGGQWQGRGRMLGRQNQEFPSHHTEPPALAAKATDLDALRTAVVDAAGVGYGLWFSYLFVLLYFATR